MKGNHQVSFVGIFSLLFATFTYGFYGILARFIGLELPLFYQTGMRAFVAAILVGVIVLLKRSWVRLNKKDSYWM